MAAFAGLGVTDAVVEVEGGELPALDGCAAEFCKGLGAAGIEKFGEAQVDGPFSRVFHIDGEIEIAISTGTGLWRYEFECGERWPNWQHFEFCFSDSFETEVAPARTFAFTEEMEAIRANGLGKGLNETSAFLIGEQGYEHQTRFDDEPARHKLLDLIGDLYLSGIPPQLLNVVGQRSGHRTNVAAAQKLRDHVTFS
jgi:UDP-3-O-acyl-N-acetylglucosamine deacetylase